MTPYLFKYFNKNEMGRDFVVGDIHGMFSLLEEQLLSINFNEKKDRLFSVGDLIDRGAESFRVIEFLDKPWFHAIKGNHEVMLIESKHQESTYRNWVQQWGGGWWEDVDSATQEEIRERLKQLPIACEVENDEGNIGIVHADIPIGPSWQEIIRDIDTDKELCEHLLWSKNRHKQIQLKGETIGVEGIGLVVMGHSTIKKPLHINNLYYIDTGACYQQNKELGRLTLLEIHPKLKEYQYPYSL